MKDNKIKITKTDNGYEIGLAKEIEFLDLQPSMPLPELFIKTMEKINEIIIILNKLEKEKLDESMRKK